LTQKNPAVWPDFLRSWFFTFLIFRVLDFSHLSCFDVKLAARPEEFFRHTKPAEYAIIIHTPAAWEATSLRHGNCSEYGT
jgi:hypothetical protein